MQIPHILFGILYCDFSMAEDIIEQIELHIREILCISSAVNVKGRELHELNALVGRIS